MTPFGALSIPLVTVVGFLLVPAPLELSREIGHYRVDPTRSHLTIHLDTAGLLGLFGHRHLIRAPIASGQVRFNRATPEHNRVRLRFMAEQIRVLDPDLAEEKRWEVQEVMQSPRVLHSLDHPLIQFNSTAVEVKAGQFTLRGHLTLRGTTRALVIRGRMERHSRWMVVSGSTRFKQTLLGIQPVSAVAGTVRVKDEMEIRFHVFLIPENAAEKIC
jgi:polyisoprenoid-binding protein YceI